MWKRVDILAYWLALLSSVPFLFAALVYIQDGVDAGTTKTLLYLGAVALWANIVTSLVYYRRRLNQESAMRFENDYPNLTFFTIEWGGRLEPFPHSGTVEEAYAKSLLHLMSAISEQYLAASWAPNLEYGLWQTMEHGSDRWIPQRDVAMLRSLSEACDGWWISSRVPDEPGSGPIEFVSTAEWKVHFERSWLPLGRSTLSG